jgi:hypothetical protein
VEIGSSGVNLEMDSSHMASTKNSPQEEEGQKRDESTTMAKFIAFSHVWGEAAGCNLDGVGKHILASPAKARFLRDHLHDLVGDHYFWMDILCIDQSNAEARIAVTRIIPELYNQALETIIIRDGQGFRTCCAGAAGEFPDFAGFELGLERLGEHWKSEHHDVLPSEGILQRLWPLQESIVSNNVRFVTLKESQNAPEKGLQSFLDFISGGREGGINATIDALWALSRAWATYGTSHDVLPQTLGRDQLVFAHALLNNGTASRAKVGRSPFSLSLGSEISLHINSIRITTKARDYVLSALSQYSWYVAPPPQDVRQMGFAALYQDCFIQAMFNKRAFLPKLTSGMVGDTDDQLVASNVPEPICLGDFVKLFGLASDCAPSSENDCARGADCGSVELYIADTLDVSSVFQILEESFTFSREAWQLAGKGELVAHGFWPDDKAFTADARDEAVIANSIRLLNLMWSGFRGGADADAKSFQRTLARANLSNYSRILLRLGALVSCGIGISAFKWSEGVLRPVLALMGPYTVLAMVSSAEDFKLNLHHVAHPFDNLMQIDGKHFVITRISGGFKPRHRCVGLIPDFTGDPQNLTMFFSREGQPWVNGKPMFPICNLI